MSQQPARLRLTGALLLLWMSLLCTSIFAQDATSWKTFRNGIHNHGATTATLPAELELLWEITTPDGVTSTPVIADGHAYVGTLSGDLHKIELKTGKVVWSYRTKVTVDPNEFAPGFNAPLAMNDTLVFGGDDFGMFHAVKIADGTSAWKVETDGEIVGGAMLIGETVIFGSHDGHLYGHTAADGERLWAAETHGPVNGTPCIVGNVTFTTGCDQPIMRTFQVDSGAAGAEIPLDALFLASAAADKGILYFGSDSGSVFALNADEKKTKWEFSVPKRQQQIQSSPALTEKYVIIGSRDKNVYCLNRETGEQVWSFQTRGRVDSSPVVSGDRIYFGSSDKNIYALDMNGKEVWKFYAKQSVTGSPAIVDGYLVIGTDSTNGRILCFGKKIPMPSGG